MEHFPGMKHFPRIPLPALLAMGIDSLIFFIINIYIFLSFYKVFHINKWTLEWLVFALNFVMQCFIVLWFFLYPAVEMKEFSSAILPAK